MLNRIVYSIIGICSSRRTTNITPRFNKKKKQDNNNNKSCANNNKSFNNIQQSTQQPEEGISATMKLISSSSEIEVDVVVVDDDDVNDDVHQQQEEKEGRNEEFDPISLEPLGKGENETIEINTTTTRTFDTMSLYNYVKKQRLEAMMDKIIDPVTGDDISRNDLRTLFEKAASLGALIPSSLWLLLLASSTTETELPLSSSTGMSITAAREEKTAATSTATSAEEKIMMMEQQQQQQQQQRERRSKKINDKNEILFLVAVLGEIIAEVLLLIEGDVANADIFIVSCLSSMISPIEQLKSLDIEEAFAAHSGFVLYLKGPYRMPTLDRHGNLQSSLIFLDQLWTSDDSERLFSLRGITNSPSSRPHSYVVGLVTKLSDEL